MDVEKEMGLKPRGKIKIVSKKVFIRGEPHYIVTHVEAAQSIDLPESYIFGVPCCYYQEVNNSKMLHVRYLKDGISKTRNIYIGGSYRVDEFEELISHIKDAGKRLSNLIKNYKETYFKDGENLWQGERIDIIWPKGGINMTKEEQLRQAFQEKGFTVRASFVI